MFPPSISSHVPPNEPNMLQNPLNEQPRRMTNPLAQNIHRVLETEELVGKISR